MRARYGDETVTPGRKSLKIAKGKIPASADVVVTLHYETGLAFYLPDEHRWVISYPQQHYQKGVAKERSSENGYKQAIRMIKAARRHLIDNKAISAETTSSYFIECLLSNVSDALFQQNLGQTYCDIVTRLSTAGMKQFKCQNGMVKLFGPGGDQWDIDSARTFITALGRLWKEWPSTTLT